MYVSYEALYVQALVAMEVTLNPELQQAQVALVDTLTPGL